MPLSPCFARKFRARCSVDNLPHRDVLACRGLAQRGKLSTSDPVLNFLARLGDNGVVWKILEFWQATR